MSSCPSWSWISLAIRDFSSSRTCWIWLLSFRYCSFDLTKSCVREATIYSNLLRCASNSSSIFFLSIVLVIKPPMDKRTSWLFWHQEGWMSAYKTKHPQDYRSFLREQYNGHKVSCQKIFFHAESRWNNFRSLIIDPRRQRGHIDSRQMALFFLFPEIPG